MRAGTVRIAILLTGIFLAAIAHAQGAPAAAKSITVYVDRVVAAPQGDVSLGTLVRTSGPLSPVEQEALARSVTVLGNAVQFIPASRYQEWIETAFGPDAIIVGTRTLLIPKGTSAETEPYLLDRLADYLVAQKLVNDGMVEMTFTQASLMGAPPQDGTPAIQVMKTGRGVEVSFLLTGSGGGSVSGRVSLPPVDSAGSTKAGLKSSTPVRVVFRKGPITVEVPGKTLGASSVEGTVNVSIAESHKTFAGRVTGERAVQVDLP
jgi:hypothetical protein